MTLFTTEESREKWNYNSKMRIVKVKKKKKVTLQKLYVPIDYITKMNSFCKFFFCLWHEQAPKQNIAKLECGYYVLRYMKEIIADVSLLMNNVS